MRREKRPYVVVQYTAGPEGRLQPIRPRICPHGEAHATCQLVLNHYRSRKSLALRIAVYSCQSHRISFAAYPPGYAPYGRSQLAPVSFNGHVISPDPEIKDPLRIFAGTVFDCVVHDDSGTKSPPSSRRVKRLCRLLGLGKGAAANDRLRMVTELGVPLAALIGAVKARTKSPRRIQGVAAIRQVLSFVRVSANLAGRLAKVAYVFGVWGRPIFG